MSAQPAHSKLGASSYERWSQCPGSVRLSEGVQKKESEFAAEGTRAHENAAAILDGKKPPHILQDEDGDTSVRMYVEFVESLTKGINAGKTWRVIEQRFDLSRYHPGLFGTADCVVYFESTKKLIVVDYKHGAGVPVEVNRNKQLFYYGIGAIHALNKPVQELELIVVQPRCYHADGPIRRWSTTPMEVMAFLADLIDDAVATEQPNAPIVVGDHCRWCAAQPICPKIREKSLVAAKEAFTNAEVYSPDRLAEMLRILPQIESWVKSVREFAYAEAQKGRIPPGWKLVQKRATRKWKEKVDEGVLSQEFGLKLPECYEIKIKSPAQMEKIIDKGLWPVLDSLVISESSGLTLASNDDARPAVRVGPGEVFDVIS